MLSSPDFLPTTKIQSAFNHTTDVNSCRLNTQSQTTSLSESEKREQTSTTLTGVQRPPLQPYFTFVFPTCPLPLMNPDLRVFIDEGRIFILLNAISLLATIPLGMPNWGLLKRRGKLSWSVPANGNVDHHALAQNFKRASEDPKPARAFKKMKPCPPSDAAIQPRTGTINCIGYAHQPHALGAKPTPRCGSLPIS
ncbi:hypothetical protein EDD22DRAFT_854112 [Suillus occidentalis]|nr:hypothetical protein EDD22DRAFT_854112 [Suillus occidentalis]